MVDLLIQIILLVRLKIYPIQIKNHFIIIHFEQCKIKKEKKKEILFFSHLNFSFKLKNRNIKSILKITISYKKKKLIFFYLLIFKYLEKIHFIIIIHK